MTYQEAVSYIKTNVSPGSRPGLERVKDLLERLGSPQQDLKIIHVTGTNGKGSVCVMLESILRAAGYRVGTFTSPYINKINECIRLDSYPIEDSALAQLTEVLKPYAEQMEDRPTEFEFLTAAALRFFKDKHCDIVILETGMGARKDATNVSAQNLLSIITNVELDHMDYLGSTIEEIAFEKSGVIKPGCPVILGDRKEEVRQVISEQAGEMGAALIQVSYSGLKVLESGINGSVISFGEFGRLQLALPGLYQSYNAAIVLTAIRALEERGISVSETAIIRGMAAAFWPGRFEQLLQDPLVIYDGAHNMNGMTATVETVRQYFAGQKIPVLMGVMADKEYESMISLLSPLTEAVYAVTPNNPRALSANELSACFERAGVKENYAFEQVEPAVWQALDHCLEQKRPLLILGSLYLYKEAAQAVCNWAENKGR